MPKRNQRRFTQEFKDEAVRMVLEGDRTIAEVASEFGIHDTTLGNWVRIYKHHHEAQETQSLSGPERAQLCELEWESRELQEKVLFLKKAAVHSTHQCNTIRDDDRGGVVWRGWAARGCWMCRSGSYGIGGRRASRSARSPERWASHQARSSRSLRAANTMS